RLSLARDLDAAIGYARDGIPVSERVAGWIAQTAGELAREHEAAAIFLPGGAAPQAGAKLRNPNLARTLEAVAQGGRAAFYGGDIAAEFARFAKARGGFSTTADFAAKSARWGEPISSSYRNVTIYQTP